MNLTTLDFVFFLLVIILDPVLVMNRPFHKLRHEHHLPHFHEVVKLIESQWDLGSIFNNSVRVVQSFQKSFENQSP